MQSLFGFGPSASAEIALTNVAGRIAKTLESGEGASSGSGTPAAQHLFVYSNGEDVVGEAKVVVPNGKKVEHLGIKVELKGVVGTLAHNFARLPADAFREWGIDFSIAELFGDRSGGHEFLSLVKELAGPGILTASQAYKFAFDRVDMPNESYEGIHARCRYFVRVIVTRSGYAVSNISKEAEFAVQNIQEAAAGDTSVKLEVGIEECLHIEFEYDKTRLSMSDVITGRVNFLLVRIKIKFMELAVIRREVAGPAGSSSTESETLTRFEVMDGCPVRGEKIPLRLYLGGIPDLTPTYVNIGNAFSVRYFVNLVLVDEEDRRYFKQQEITLWRKELQA